MHCKKKASKHQALTATTGCSPKHGLLCASPRLASPPGPPRAPNSKVAVEGPCVVPGAKFQRESRTVIPRGQANLPLDQVGRQRRPASSLSILRQRHCGSSLFEGSRTVTCTRATTDRRRIHQSDQSAARCTWRVYTEFTSHRTLPCDPNSKLQGKQESSRTVSLRIYRVETTIDK